MVTDPNTPRKNFRRNSAAQFAAAVVLLVLANVVASYWFARIDLTSEKRYTLSADTRGALASLKDVVLVKVYLDGDLPPAYRRLRGAIRELLDEFRVVAGDNLEYEFIDPSASPDATERNTLYQQLAQVGIQPTNLRERAKDKTTEKVIFPGARLSYLGREVTLQLLKSRVGAGAEEMVNGSIEGLEYEFMNALRKARTAERKRVAFLQGHGELNTRQLTDAARSLSESYDVDTVVIGGSLSALKPYKAVIVAKPDSAFSERDKFILDQYILNGGKVLWFIDQMAMNMDSLEASSQNVAVAKDLNLDDLLFHYGARLNYDLVSDLQAAPIPVVTGYVGNQPQQNLFPWYYYPLLVPRSLHPIVHNLNAIKMEFAGTIDTVEAAGIRKTVLLATSRYSNTRQAPVRVSLNILQREPRPEEFPRHDLAVAVLLEGAFTSAFRHRIPEAIAQSPEIRFRELGVPGKMIVVSDGDAIASHVTRKGKIFPLGYDRFTGENYGNRNFFLNCVDYLLSDDGLMTLRSKEFRIRLLDKSKASEPWIAWVNLLLPVAVTGLAGAAGFWIRRKRNRK